MSFTDPAEGAQPPEGQGAAGHEAPYAEYLNRIPEDVRGHVEPVFKEWDANTTRRFQDHAEFRKQWEPYEPLGVTEYSPDEVAWALQFRRAAVDNPNAIKDWYKQYEQANGLAESAPPPEATPFQGGTTDPYGLDDPSTQGMAELLKQQLGPVQQQLEQINQWRQAQEQDRALVEARQYISNQMGELKAKHPDEFNEQAVERLVAQYIETDPHNAVRRAFADWQSIRTQIERDTLQSKVNQPPPAESGGAADAAPEPIRTLADANRIALERLRQARTA